jgi:phenylacetic acid degradation operon negative regulatory protein
MPLAAASPSPDITRLMDPGPPRVWSLIVSVFGDAVVPRGGSIALTSLLDITRGFGIEDGAVRTALSRLAKDGWVERTRLGRKAFYRLTPWARDASIEVSARIYAARPPSGDVAFRFLLLDEADLKARGRSREALLRIGAGTLAPNVLVLPAHRSVPAGPWLAVAGPVEGEHAGRRLVAVAWSLEPLAAAYADFVSLVAPLERSLVRGGEIGSFDALALRILLIHRFRRLVLRDPDLPQELLPADWPGHDARRSAGLIWRALAPAAERWLDDTAQSESGRFAPLERWAAVRFRD